MIWVYGAPVFASNYSATGFAPKMWTNSQWPLYFYGTTRHQMLPDFFSLQNVGKIGHRGAWLVSGKQFHPSLIFSSRGIWKRTLYQPVQSGVQSTVLSRGWSVDNFINIYNSNLQTSHIWSSMCACGYNLLAGATRPCPGHYIKIIKCTVRAKVARYVSPKVC